MPQNVSDSLFQSLSGALTARPRQGAAPSSPGTALVPVSPSDRRAAGPEPERPAFALPAGWQPGMPIRRGVLVDMLV